MTTTEGEVVKAPQGLHRRFTPPITIPEFEVETVLLQPHESISLRAIDGPAILLVLGGEGSAHAEGGGGGEGESREALHRGCVFFVPANTDLRLRGATTPTTGAGAAAPLHVAIAHHNTCARRG
jgi:quercetin dioxygenase-like cupin family protein